MNNPLYMRDIISISDLNSEEISLILETARAISKQGKNASINNKIIANCFFEPSTRTRLSFEAAALRMGGKVMGFSDISNTSITKGENLHDSIRVISQYSDLIVLRHPKEGAARLAADISAKPVINAGDGSNQHPTQTLLDLYTIQESQQTLQGLHIAFVGDLKYSRTIHSLAFADLLQDARFYFIAPEHLTMPDYICDHLKRSGIKFSFHSRLEEIIQRIDILYMTRFQKERFDEADREIDHNSFVLKSKSLVNAKENLKILHPLPRNTEIDPECDKTPFAYYFQQAENGLYIRQALLNLILNEEAML